jgi:hypothetical protein
MKQEVLSLTVNASKEVSTLNIRLETLASDKQQLELRLAEEAAAVAEKLQAMQKENELLAVKLAAAQAASVAAADKIASLTLFEASWTEGQQRENELCRNIDMLQEQQSRLVRELEEKQAAGSREEALAARVALLEQEAEAARSDMERLRSSGFDAAAAEIKALATAKMDIETEYIRLANERREQEEEMLDALYEAEQEIMRLSAELEKRSKETAVEPKPKEPEKIEPEVVTADRAGKSDRLSSRSDPAAATAAEAVETAPAQPPETRIRPPSAVIDEEPLTEIETVETEPLPPTPDMAPAAPAPAEAGPAPVRPAAETQATPEVLVEPVPVKPAAEPVPPPQPPPAVAVESAAPADTFEDEDMPIAGDHDVLSGLVNEFGSFCGSSGDEVTGFAIDPQLTAVEYSHPAEVIAVIYSCNSVQAVPDGSSTQSCKGYVVALKKGDDYFIYAAWYLPENKKVIVCTPERQPADSTECTRILQDAVAYFEVVGFMMEFEDLGHSVSSYNRILKKIPVLRRIR